MTKKGLNIIGHAEALRTRDNDLGWIYQDKTNQSLYLILSFHGLLHEQTSMQVDLAVMDAFIERLEADGAPAGDELRERRRNVLRAFSELPEKNGKNNDYTGWLDAVKVDVEWIYLRMESIKREDFLLQLVKARIKKEFDCEQLEAKK